MRSMLCLLLTFAATSAHAGDATKFNGFSVNMTRQEILSAKPDNLRYKPGKSPNFILFRDPKIPDLFSDDGKGCVAIDMNGDTIETMDLRKCFFGAEDMSAQQFIKTIIKSYGLNASCSMKVEPDRSIEPYCSGATNNGEAFEITTAGIKIRKSTQTPKFN